MNDNSNDVSPTVLKPKVLKSEKVATENNISAKLPNTVDQKTVAQVKTPQDNEMQVVLNMYQDHSYQINRILFAHYSMLKIETIEN